MEHKKIDLGNIHKPHNWEFADATARAAAVIADSDLIGALALQLDDGTYWRLTSVGPTVWTKAATPNATDAELRDRSTHTGSQAISTVSGLQTALDAAASHASSTSNPHAVTKAQVGLGNVENKSSADIRSEISSGNVTTALGYTPLAPSVVGDTVASLVAGKVPSSQLPAYVDDVLEYANLAGFPGTGTAGIIYVALDTNKTYRWSGSAYTEISPSPGSTDSVTEGSSNLYFTAARVRDAVLTGLTTVSSAVIAASDSVIGAFQKLQAQITAHTTNTSNPHSVTKTQVGLSNVDNTADSAKSVNYAITAGSAPASDVYSWAKASTKPSYSKSEVGLGSVDNTSDTAKPVSTAQQTAIDAKLNAANAIPTGSGIQSDENEIIRSGFDLAGGANLDISTKAFASSNKWRLFVIGAFANGYEGNGLTNLPCFIEVSETANTIAVGGITILTFTRNATTGKINVSNGSESYPVQFTGTIFVISYIQGQTPTESMRLLNALSVGKFGCNGATPQAKASLNAASSDLSSVIALCNQIRTALINTGIAQ